MDVQGHYYETEADAYKAANKSLYNREKQIEETDNKLVPYDMDIKKAIIDLKYSFKVAESVILNNVDYGLNSSRIQSIVNNALNRDGDEFEWAKSIRLDATSKPYSGKPNMSNKVKKPFPDAEADLIGVAPDSLEWDLRSAKLNFNKTIKEMADLQQKISGYEDIVKSIYSYQREMESKYLDMKLKINKGKTW